MNSVAHIFDLDDTLVQYHKKNMNVPKQTFHCLRNLSHQNCFLGIISFNPFAPFIAHSLGLMKYVFNVISDSRLNRVELIQKILTVMTNSTEIHYWDDRLDNIHCIYLFFPFIQTHHVINPQNLFKDLQMYSVKKH